MISESTENINPKCKAGVTSLHHAAEYGVVQLMHKNDEDPNSENVARLTFLEFVY